MIITKKAIPRRSLRDATGRLPLEGLSGVQRPRRTS